MKEDSGVYTVFMCVYLNTHMQELISRMKLCQPGIEMDFKTQSVCSVHTVIIS